MLKILYIIPVAFAYNANSALHFNMIRAGDITYHRHGWPENLTLEHAQEIWMAQDQKMKQFLERLIRPVFPNLIRASSESNLSSECQASMFKMLLAIRSMKSWAINMMDASAKLPNGIFTGTSTVFGNFDQCLSIRVGDPDDNGFRGKYCYLKTTAPNLPRPSLNSSEVVSDDASILNWFYNNAYWIQQFGGRMGVCFPSLCTDDDISKLMTYAFSSINAVGKVMSCYEDEQSEFNEVQTFILWCFALQSVIVFVCTTYHLLTASKSGSLFQKLIANFSLIHNSELLFRTERMTRDIKVLHGIRVISCAWIVLGHIYFMTSLDSFARFSSLQKLQDLLTNFLFTAIEHFALPVDTFFAITGILLVWSRRSQDKFSWKFWLSQMRHRVYRIYPCYLLLHGLYVIAPSLGNGPIWKETFSTLNRNIYSTGWVDLIFLNNYVSWSSNIAVHTWFVAVNIQLCSIGVPLAYCLRKHTRTTIIYMALGSILGCFVATGLIYFNGYPPSMLMMTSQYEKAIDFISYVYYQPTTHLAPFCMGMILGHVLVEGNMPRFSKFGLIFGNACSLLFLFFAVFGAYPFRAGWPIDYFWIALYGGFHRIIWTLGICWFVLLSQTGQGGAISAFLSANFWIPFSSLSFTVYLLHPIPILLYVATTREIQQLDHFYIAILFFGIWTISHFIAYVCHLTVELPFAGLEKIVQSYRKEKNSFRVESTKIASTFVEIGNEVEIPRFPIRQENQILDFHSAMSRNVSSEFPQNRCLE